MHQKDCVSAVPDCALHLAPVSWTLPRTVSLAHIKWVMALVLLSQGLKQKLERCSRDETYNPTYRRHQRWPCTYYQVQSKRKSYINYFSNLYFYCYCLYFLKSDNPKYCAIMIHQTASSVEVWCYFCTHLNYVHLKNDGRIGEKNA